MKAKEYRREIPNFKALQLGPAIGAFAIGATAGSLLALLFAPTSGKVTRKRIGMQLRQAKRLLVKKADLLREAATEKIGETREWLVDRVIHTNGKHPHRVASHA